MGGNTAIGRWLSFGALFAIFLTFMVALAFLLFPELVDRVARQHSRRIMSTERGLHAAYSLVLEAENNSDKVVVRQLGNRTPEVLERSILGYQYSYSLDVQAAKRIQEDRAILEDCGRQGIYFSVNNALVGRSVDVVNDPSPLVLLLNPRPDDIFIGIRANGETIHAHQ